jgi:hypothetical protein
MLLASQNVTADKFGNARNARQEKFEKFPNKQEPPPIRLSKMKFLNE